MQINWESTINQIFSDTLTCPRCSLGYAELVVSYSRRTSLNSYAPRHRECPRGNECEARKLITLCEVCANEENVPGMKADADQLLEAYIIDCRRDLEDALDYLSDLWRDDIDLESNNLEKRLEDVDPNTYKDEIAWRDRLESEYLSYHNEFRKRKIRIPHPGWVSEYVEEILSLGYETQLGN